LLVVTPSLPPIYVIRSWKEEEEEKKDLHYNDDDCEIKIFLAYLKQWNRNGLRYYFLKNFYFKKLFLC